MTERDMVLSITDCKQGLSPTYPRDHHGHVLVRETRFFLSDSYDPRREVRLFNETSGTPLPSHQVKQTPHESRYTRRSRTEMCQSVCVTNTVNRKGEKNLSNGIRTTDRIGEGKSHRRIIEPQRVLYPGRRKRRDVSSPCQVATT